MIRRGISRVIVIAALLAAGAVGCKNALLSGGILHFDQKRYDRAREVLLDATKQEPNNPEAWLWLGKAYAELDSTQQARASFDKAIQLAEPTKPEVKTDATNALEHYWSTKHNEGLASAKAAHDAGLADKKDEEKKDYRLAINSFKKARVYMPEKADTPRNMGVCYFNLGEADSGLMMLTESHRLAPNDQASTKLLCDSYRSIGDQAASADKVERQGLENAVKAYKQAVELCGNDPDLLFSLGVVYYQLAEVDSTHKESDYLAAVDAFEKTLAVKPDDQEALYNTASLYYELKQCEKGLERAKALVDLDPKKGRYQYILGRLYGCTGNKNEAYAGVILQRSLTGTDPMPADEFRQHVQQAEATSDLMRKYREEGMPEDVRTFTEQATGSWETWFYWSRGKAYAFQNGTLKYERTFKPVKAESGSK